jgi:methanogenic corrinoid protein MtbC1
MTDLSSNYGDFGSEKPFSNQKSFLPRIVAAESQTQPTLGHDVAAKSASMSTESGITEGDITQFCEIVTSGDQSRMAQTIATLQARGITNDSLLLDLLPRVAEEVGRQWTNDESDFASVTITMGYLQKIRREISCLNGSALMLAGPPRRALLAPTPGEQHNFGLMVVDHFLHQAGWQVTTLPHGDADDMASRLSQEAFEVAGLSISCEAYLLKLEKLIATIRRTSRNRNIGILVGGRLFLEQPNLAVLIGADATAQDGRDAVLQAEKLAAGKSCLLLTE